MKNLHTLLAAMVLCPMIVLAESAPPASAHWTGAINAARDIEMSLDLAQNAKGEWIGSMSLPAFNLIDLPVEKLSINGRKILFGADGSSYEAEVSADGKRLLGSVVATIGSASFQLTRDGEADVKVAPPSTAIAPEFEGLWEGSIKVPSGDLGIQLRLTHDAEGRAKGTVTTLGREKQELALTTVQQSGKDLLFEIRSVRGTFKGSMDPENVISGTWTEASEEPRILTVRRSQ